MSDTPPEELRDSLHDLAGQVVATDLYERAVHRSGRIARREAAIGTGAALLVLGVLAAGLWRMPGTGSQPTVALASATSLPASPSPSDSDSPSPAAARAGTTDRATHRPSPAVPPRMVEPPADPRSRVLTDLPGQVFYQESGDRPDVLRLRPSDGRTDRVLAGAPSPVGISPDGSRIAYVEGSTLMVAGDGDTQVLAEGVATDDQAPAWSPDGTRLLVHATTPSVVEVATGAVTPLPGDLEAGRQFRWSGDGRKLIYATATCGLEMAGSAARSGTAVPLADPDGVGVCQAGSVDETGRRVAVSLLSRPGSTAATSDAVVDTATGDLVALPVSGQVLGAVFDARGYLLVRTLRAGTTRLSLIAPDNSLVVQAAEPAAVEDLDLIAYTG